MCHTARSKKCFDNTHQIKSVQKIWFRFQYIIIIKFFYIPFEGRESRESDNVYADNTLCYALVFAESDSVLSQSALLL